jgi:hypothetical protein
VLNGDDPLVLKLATGRRARVLFSLRTCDAWYDRAAQTLVGRRAQQR